MDFRGIKKMLDRLPDEVVRSIGVDGVAVADALPFLPEQARWLSAYRKLDFGWHYCRVLVENDLPFPDWLPKRDRCLHRAWLWMLDPKTYSRPDVEGAVVLRQQRMAESRALVEAMLLTGANEDEIALRTGIKSSTLRMYSVLFFCAADRKEDALFLQHVFPRGLLPQMSDGYIERTDYRDILLRTGWMQGGEYLDWLSAVDGGRLVREMSASGSSAKFERLMLANGLLLAEMGMVNQDSAKAIGSAGRLVAAGKIGGVAEAAESPFSAVANSLSRELEANLTNEYKTAASKTIRRMFGETQPLSSDPAEE